MAAELEFVDSGRFLENRSMPDMETILRKQIIDSICHSSNGQATIKCEDKVTYYHQKNYPLIGPLVKISSI